MCSNNEIIFGSRTVPRREQEENLLLAKKLKVKYSKEKALAHRKSINQTGFGPKASCVGDVAFFSATVTKLYKVGMIQA